MDKNTSEVDHERFFEACPEAVFAGIVNVLSRHGHVHGIERFGREVVFTPSLSPVSDVRRLRARVVPWHGGTLVHVRGDSATDPTPDDEHAEHLNLLKILGMVHDQMPQVTQPVD